MLSENKIESLVDLLKDIERDYGPAALASSFSIEDMVLTDAIVRHTPGINIFTLDTGRLPAETYVLMQKTHQKYDGVVGVYSPDCGVLAEFVQAYGPNAFYDSVEQRKECCRIRKLEPLNRALNGHAAWITGLRREQSVTRTDTQHKEWDEAHGMHKFNPLLDWTEQEVWAYIRRYDVPFNKLHEKGYPSIGCAPCTRSVAEGEDIRAGRWWWENPETKECGLHVKTAG
ncbi:MAG TPA: phosphoadenylyl-sulfate reductase [Chromatiales bacterium]|nr:phosphoadenylyl-sulfate reductase [Chromatiales bacterium]HEX21996.1 phosphoadenylyl-sulfate reductase [Chromatiales bacterium]